MWGGVGEARARSWTRTDATDRQPEAASGRAVTAGLGEGPIYSSPQRDPRLPRKGAKLPYKPLRGAMDLSESSQEPEEATQGGVHGLHGRRIEPADQLADPGAAG